MYYEADINSYAACVSLYSGVRSPEKGKPLRRRWARLFKLDDGSFEVRTNLYGMQPLLRITPDNMCEFVMPKENFLRITVTLAQALHKLVPLYVERRAAQRYGFVSLKLMEQYAHEKQVANDENVHWNRWQYRREYFKDNAVEYEEGLKFNLATGETPNGRWKTQTEIPEKRKEWRNALRRWKYGIKARARVGALEGVIDQVWTARSNLPKGAHWTKPDWQSDEWVKLLSTSIQKNEYPQEVLQGFVQSCAYSYWNPARPTTADVVESCNYVLKTLSTPLRRELGVLVDGDEA